MKSAVISFDFRSIEGPPPEQLTKRHVAPEAASFPRARYGDAPDLGSRLFGAGATLTVCLSIVLLGFAGWHVAREIITVPQPLVVHNLLPVAAPDQPVQEVPEGPEAFEQREQQPLNQEQLPSPDIALPSPNQIAMPVRPPVEVAAPKDPVTETSAPRSIPAPPAAALASDAAATWEAQLLAHLERHRRYPAAARARRQQGVAHVRFRMDREGKVLSAAVIRSSGSAVLDRAAIDTIHRAQPLPVIPADRPGELALTVPVEFFVK